MTASRNPIEIALINRGISVPENPVDLSSVFIAAGVKRKYMISMTGRCGSTWLAASLAQLPSCGNPLEYFSEEAIPHYGKPDGSGDFSQFIASIVASTKTDAAFGLKIDGMRLRWLSSVCDIGLSFAPDQTAWVDMRRLNIVKQAFSFVRAKKTGVWHNYVNLSVPAGSDRDGSDFDHPTEGALTAVDESDVWREILRLAETERALDGLYVSLGIKPLRIFYEEMLDSKPFVLLRVLGHLFPKRTFTDKDVQLADPTSKVSYDFMLADEMSFVSRHAKSINVVQEYRSDHSLEFGKLKDLLRSETARA